MTLQWIERGGGWAGIAGGALLIGYALATAALPEGCAGAACALPGRAMRDDGALPALLVTGLFGVGWGAAAMIGRLPAGGRWWRLGRRGVGAGVAGSGAIIAGRLVALAAGDDVPWMPLLVLPGALALVAGCLTAGVAMLRGGALPGWVAALLIGGAAVLLGFNDQDGRALLLAPLGLAWVAVGGHMLAARGRPTGPGPG